MLDIRWDVVIADNRLTMMESMVIVRSTEMLADTATVVLPGTMYGKALDVESRIRRGDAVLIWCGYGALVPEFAGYVESIRTDGGSVTIACEDELFKFRTDMPDTELKGYTLEKIAKWVASKVGKYEVSCSYDMTYDKFAVNNATGWDVLKKLQEETKANIYIKDNTLHIHPRYAEIFGAVAYDFAINIEREGTDIKYRRADERKLMVSIDAKDKQGKSIKVEYGDTGGDKYSMSIGGVSDTASLKKMAQEAHAQRIYEGYEGQIQGWLVPYCDAGYKVRIADADYEYKTGWYYCPEVKTTVNASGGKREVKLGKRLSDG